MTGEVTDAAAVAERDRHDRWLHRVTHGSHHRAELGCRVDGLEVHAAAHADLARPPEHDRGLGGGGIERVVGPAEEPAAPRRLVVRRAVDAPAGAGAPWQPP